MHGANDGIVSTGSLMLGVATASVGASAGAEQKDDPVSEHSELAAIYVGRGLDINLARQVADQLMANDAPGAHAMDELGISVVLST